MVTSAYDLPTVYNDMVGADWWTWLTLHYLADTKFMSIFAILFGAGVCIFMERAQAKGHAVWKLQISRMSWLLVIGVLHAYLIWFGDILVPYAICGMFVALLRKWKPATLCIVGFATMFIIPIGIWLLFYWTMQFWPEEQLLEMQQSSNIGSPAMQAEIAAYTGPWTGQLEHRITVAMTLQLFILPLYLCWHVIGLMMLGMAMYKWKIFVCG